MSRPLRRGARLWIFALLSAAALAIGPGAAPVEAHALLRSAQPAAGSEIGTAPSSIRLTFGEALDLKLSTVKVLDSGGSNHATGGLTAASGDPASVTVPVGPLAEGVYTVAWRTVSSVDGHVAAGSFAFGVGVAPTSAGTGSTPEATGGSPAAIVARAFLYAGLLLLLGAGYVGFFVGGPTALRRERLRRVLLGAWLLAAAGSAAVVAVTWSEAGADLASVASSSIGQAGILRIAAVLLAGVAVAIALARTHGQAGGELPALPGRRWLALVSLGAVLGLTIDVLNGHAAAVGNGPLQLGLAIQLAAQWSHAIAAGLWLGGLGALLLTLGGAGTDEVVTAVRRFSTWAAPWIALVALTGVVRAIQEVGSVDELLAADYGRMVVVKTALLVVLAVLGAGNRWWSVPRAAASLRPLRQIGVSELGVACVVIAFSAGLVNGVPPSSLGPAAGSGGPAPIVVNGSDAGTSTRVRLSVTPGAAGFNTFEAVATDFDSGAPVTASAVSLRFELLSRPGVGGSSLPLQAGAGGGWSASGAPLAVDGIWRVTATVTRSGGSGGSVEVPFVLATSIPGEPTDVLPTPGSPTIYTVHLADGTSCQIYLDPERAGAAELHATFFDATGNERPITNATMASTGGAGRLLSPRLLEPGHFVADLQVEAGTLPVDVIGIDGGGNQVHVHATIEVQP